MQKYDAFEVGQLLKKIRTNKDMTREYVSEITGISVSGIKQLESGNRNMNMKTLHLFMNAFGCDANTLLNIEETEYGKEKSIDKMLLLLPDEERVFFINSFSYMIDAATKRQFAGR